MAELRNSVYIFIPFTGPLTAWDPEAAGWEPMKDDVKYLFRYISDKICPPDGGTCHYRLCQERWEKKGLGEPGTVLRLEEPRMYSGRQTTFPMCLEEVQLFAFRTDVGILAFRFRMESSDPQEIAAAEYYLKKVSKERIAGAEAPFTLLEAAKRLMGDRAEELRFFFYANAGTERANVLTYAETETLEKSREQLYFLRRCLHQGFNYEKDEKSEEREVWFPTAGIAWGISPEAAACLCCPEEGETRFLRKEFYQNQRSQYLLTYVLLLHQKYVLYRFLTDVSRMDDLETLEDYSRRLDEFEADYVFSLITEVPQYQTMYERSREAFALEKMYKDVREPLRALESRRRAAQEQQQQKRDGALNLALSLLSLLSVCSALTDSFAFVDGYFPNLQGGSLYLVRAALIVLTVGLGLFVLIRLLRTRKK